MDIENLNEELELLGSMIRAERATATDDNRRCTDGQLEMTHKALDTLAAHLSTSKGLTDAEIPTLVNKIFDEWEPVLPEGRSPATGMMFDVETAGVVIRYLRDRGMLPSSNVPGAGVRPAVAWFAQRMEDALRRNDHKGGWSAMTYSRLMSRLDDESRELFLALDRMKSMNGEQSVINEAADVANFAMMIADNQGPRIGHGQASPASPPLTEEQAPGATR